MTIYSLDVLLSQLEPVCFYTSSSNCSFFFLIFIFFLLKNNCFTEFYCFLSNFNTVLTVASWPAYRFLKRQVRWFGIPISWKILHSCLWSTQSKSLTQSMKQKYMLFLKSLAFSMIQGMLAIWPVVPLLFLNPVCTSRNSRFTYCWRAYLGGFWAWPC